MVFVPENNVDRQSQSVSSETVYCPSFHSPGPSASITVNQNHEENLATVKFLPKTTTLVNGTGQLFGRSTLSNRGRSLTRSSVSRLPYRLPKIITIALIDDQNAGNNINSKISTEECGSNKIGCLTKVSNNLPSKKTRSCQYAVPKSGAKNMQMILSDIKILLGVASTAELKKTPKLSKNDNLKSANPATENSPLVYCGQPKSDAETFIDFSKSWYLYDPKFTKITSPANLYNSNSLLFFLADDAISLKNTTMITTLIAEHTTANQSASPKSENNFRSQSLKPSRTTKSSNFKTTLSDEPDEVKNNPLKKLRPTTSSSRKCSSSRTSSGSRGKRRSTPKSDGAPNTPKLKIKPKIVMVKSRSQSKTISKKADNLQERSEVVKVNSASISNDMNNSKTITATPLEKPIKQPVGASSKKNEPSSVITIPAISEPNKTVCSELNHDRLENLSADEIENDKPCASNPESTSKCAVKNENPLLEISSFQSQHNVSLPRKYEQTSTFPRHNIVFQSKDKFHRPDSSDDTGTVVSSIRQSTKENDALVLGVDNLTSATNHSTPMSTDQKCTKPRPTRSTSLSANLATTLFRDMTSFQKRNSLEHLAGNQKTPSMSSQMRLVSGGLKKRHRQNVTGSSTFRKQVPTSEILSAKSQTKISHSFQQHNQSNIKDTQEPNLVDNLRITYAPEVADSILAQMEKGPEKNRRTNGDSTDLSYRNQLSDGDISLRADSRGSKSSTIRAASKRGGPKCFSRATFTIESASSHNSLQSSTLSSFENTTDNATDSTDSVPPNPLLMTPLASEVNMANLHFKDERRDVRHYPTGVSGTSYLPQFSNYTNTMLAGSAEARTCYPDTKTLLASAISYLDLDPAQGARRAIKLEEAIQKLHQGRQGTRSNSPSIHYLRSSASRNALSYTLSGLSCNSSSNSGSGHQKKSVRFESVDSDETSKSVNERSKVRNKSANNFKNGNNAGNFRVLPMKRSRSKDSTMMLKKPNHIDYTRLNQRLAKPKPPKSTSMSIDKTTTSVIDNARSVVAGVNHTIATAHQTTGLRVYSS